MTRSDTSKVLYAFMTVTGEWDSSTVTDGDLISYVCQFPKDIAGAYNTNHSRVQNKSQPRTDQITDVQIKSLMRTDQITARTKQITWLKCMHSYLHSSNIGEIMFKSKTNGFQLNVMLKRSIMQ